MSSTSRPTHQELKEWCLHAMGGKVPVNARPTWGQFQRSRGTRIRLAYDWIKNPGFYKFVSDHPHLEFGDGEEYYTVEIIP